MQDVRDEITSADKTAPPVSDAETNQTEAERNTTLDSEAADVMLVSWNDSDDKDPAKPQSWLRSRKWCIIAVLSATTLST